MTDRTIVHLHAQLFRALVALAVLGAGSCDGCAGGQGSGGGGGPSAGGGGGWMVGQGGLMLNIADDNGRVGRYPLQPHGDLLAIRCWGPRRAWVAGDGGTLLTTEDAGASWRAVDAGSAIRLRTVAMAEGNRVFVAGDQGLLRVSDDGGLTWRTIVAPPVGWTSLAPRQDGALALLTTGAGDVYRLEGEALTRVATSAVGALDAVALSPDGTAAAAVGDGGTILVSDDGGRSWRQRPSGTTRALHGVWLSGPDGSGLTAVGDGGVLVRGLRTASDGAPPRTLGQAPTLRGLHLEASGRGTIVGDAGAVFVTRDFGDSWSPVATGEHRDLYSVDALGDDDEHL